MWTFQEFTQSLWERCHRRGLVMNIDHFAAGGRRRFPANPQPDPTPHSKHPAICHFHISCALRKTKWLIKIRKKRARAHGCTFPRSLLLDFIKMIKYHYWNLKKCHTVKNPLKWERTLKKELNSTNPKAFSASASGNAFQESSVNKWWIV